MKLRHFLSFLIFSLSLGLSSAAAESASDGWEIVGTGIEYREFQLPDPNNVYVARMDRSNSNVTIETSIAQGALAFGTETVSGMANRYDQALSYWGQSWGPRNQVVVAINGSFYDPDTGVPQSGQIHSGWYAKRFGDLGGSTGFVWDLDRVAFIGQCAFHRPEKQFITFLASGNTQRFDGINRARGTDELILYTPQYDAHTFTDDSGAEVLVEMTRPALILPEPAMAKGYVREIRDGQGSTPLPFDHIVLSATGNTRSTLLSNVSVGDEIGVSQEITHLEKDCSTPYAFDWTKSFASVGGSFDFLMDGVIRSFSDPGATERHPRTAVCFNDAHIYFIVVDGRDPADSVGMTIEEVAAFCKDTLTADWGINQDGGGSSTIVVNGVIKNNPSDGSERAVANGLMMVVVEPLERSTTFTPDDPIVTISTAEVRLGPGANYLVQETVPERTTGIVLDHFNNLAGILSTGSHWWKVDLEGTVGWVAEEALASNVVTGFIVESRAGGLNYSNYADSSLDDSPLKSDAPGTTAGIGSRQGKLKAAGPTRWASFNHTPTDSGIYEVYATWAASQGNGAQVEHIIGHDGGSTSVLVDQSIGANNWNSMGQYSLTANTSYTVRVTNENFPAPNSSGEVFRADAVRWQLVSSDLPPSASVASPADGSTVSGSVTIQVSGSDAEDPDDALTVEVSIDGGAWQAADYNSVTAYYELAWDTSVESDGTHTIGARATDSAGSIGESATVTVTTENVDDPPSANIVNPPDGSTVAGQVAIEVGATDDRDAVGTLLVEVSIDGGNWLTASYNSSSGYYELTWDTVAVADGGHAIDARASDSAGNVASAPQIAVTVDNTGGELHVGDLDGVKELKGKSGRWEVTVTVIVHDGEHAPAEGVTVTGEWSGALTGSVSGTTASDGSVSFATGTMTSGDIVTFTMTDLALSGYTYAQTANHDPDGDSNGTSITVTK